MSAGPDGEFLLTLADGTCLALCPGDADAARVVAFLAQAARLAAAPLPLPDGVRRLRAVVGDGASACAAAPCGDVVYRLEPTDVKRMRGRTLGPDGRLTHLYEQVTPEQWLWGQLVRLSAAIGRETQPGGGLLLHSALACLPCIPTVRSTATQRRAIGEGGEGVLLGGRSGVGKTTASLRLRPPWRSLGDDMVLVVRDASGGYWAHPWPTWSRLLGQDVRHPDGRWDVQRAVPLRALFFLEQAPDDRAQAIGPGQAVCRLAALAEQASRSQLLGRPLEEIAAFNLQRFENLCALAKALPAYVLHLSLDGEFWPEMERVLGT